MELFKRLPMLRWRPEPEKPFISPDNSTVLMILAALMGILSSIDVWGLKLWWAVLAVIFPTLSAFERQAKSEMLPA